MNSLQECVNEYIKDGYTRNYAISSIIYMVLSDKMFIQNLSNNNNWTGQSISNILKTIKKYFVEL